MPLCPQAFVGPESSARAEDIGICNGCVTYGKTVQMTAVTTAAASCPHDQVRSLTLSKSCQSEQAGFLFCSYHTFFNSPSFLLGSSCLGLSLSSSCDHFKES